MYRKTHTMRWLRSILTIMVLSLLLSSLLGIYMLKVLERNVLSANADVISYVQRSIDSRLQQLYHYSNVVEITKENIYLKNIETPVSDVPTEAYQLSESMKNYLVTNPQARGVYIYYPRADLVVGNMGCFQPRSYYALQQVPDRTGEAQWQQMLLEQHGSSFILLPIAGDQRLCYIRQTKSVGEVVAVTVIEVDREKLLQEFTPEEADSDAALAVMLSGQTVAYTGNQELLSVIPRMYEQWKSGNPSEMRFQGTIGFFHQSNLSGLEYVNISSSGTVFRTVWMTLRVCLLGAMGCLAFDVLASVAVSSRNAKPLKKLLSQLGASDLPGQDEYEFITARFQQMTTQQHRNEELAQKHQSLLNDAFLHTVLRGGLYSENAVFMAAKRYDVSFEHPCYQILVLSCVGQSISDGGPERIRISRHLESLGYESLVSAFNGQYVILLNSEECLSEAEKEEAAKFLLDHIFHDLSAYVGIGPGYDSMVDILTSYNCALLALNQSGKTPGCSIYHYTENLVRTGSGDPSVMQAFTHYMYTKEFGQAQKLLERLYTEYLRTGGIRGIEIVRQNAVDSLIIDALKQTLLPEKAEQAMMSLMTAGPPDQHRDRMNEALLMLIRESSVPKREKTPVACRAKQLIDENYTDSMMGLYMISEQLSVSNSYLSTSFKNTYGISIISYINRLRIDRAKQLILNSEKSIKEIAQEVGFSSDVNFIRVFKKMENLTPSSLRKEKNKI